MAFKISFCNFTLVLGFKTYALQRYEPKILFYLNTT